MSCVIHACFCQAAAPRDVILAAADEGMRQRCISALEAAMAGTGAACSLQDIASTVALTRDLLSLRSVAARKAAAAALGIAMSDPALKALGFDLPSLKALGFDAAAFRAAGCDWRVLRADGFSVAEVRAAGCDLAAAVAAGYGGNALVVGGFSVCEVVASGCDVADMSIVTVSGCRPLQHAVLHMHTHTHTPTPVPPLPPSARRR